MDGFLKILSKRFGICLPQKAEGKMYPTGNIEKRIGAFLTER
jgi:hypothetical protein